MKDGKAFPLSTCKRKQKISLFSSNQAKRLVNASKHLVRTVLKPQGNNLKVVFKYKFATKERDEAWKETVVWLT